MSILYTIIKVKSISECLKSCNVPWYTIRIAITFTPHMGIKDFVMKKMVEKQLKDMPVEQRDMIMKLLENNPDLFMKMSKEVEHKIKKEGKDQMLAMMEVGKKYQKELKEALQG
jgi:hypothetical protein